VHRTLFQEAFARERFIQRPREVALKADEAPAARGDARAFNHASEGAGEPRAQPKKV
jgi:hypothetical protein